MPGCVVADLQMLCATCFQTTGLFLSLILCSTICSTLRVHVDGVSTT